MKYLVSYLVAIITLFVALSPAKATAAAKFYMSPSSGTYKAGDTVTASILVDTGGQAINAAEGSVTYSADTLEYQNVSTSGTIFTFWTSGPTGSNSSVTFGGGLSNPGFNGSAGKVLTITWKAKANGTATIAMQGSKILANDGAGTDIMGPGSGAVFTIGTVAATSASPKASPASTSLSIKSTSHPDSNKWYNNKNVVLSWSFAGSNGYTFAFDQTASTTPGGSVVGTTSKTFENTADGVWYFHVKAKTGSTFTPVSHFKVQIDTVAPDEFKTTIDQPGGASNPTPTVSFETKDATGGIDRYEAQIDGGEAFAIKSGDHLPGQRPGKHKLVIRAIDKAGNSRESSAEYTTEGITPPIIVSWTKTVGLLSGVRFIGRAGSDDTIHVFINGKEVDHFLTKDKQVPFDKVANKGQALADFSSEAAFEYSYNAPLLPGEYKFSFSRTTAQNAESAQTVAYKVTIISSAITIGGIVLPAAPVLIGMMILLILLILVIIYLGYRLRHVVGRTREGASLAISRVRRLFSQTERGIDKEIGEVIADPDLGKKTRRQVKKELTDRVHDEIKESEEALDKLK